HASCPHGTSCFHQPATSQIYTLSLHDALPISPEHPTARAATHSPRPGPSRKVRWTGMWKPLNSWPILYRKSAFYTPRKRLNWRRSEEHTSELQSRENLVCRLLLEKKKLTQLL